MAETPLIKLFLQHQSDFMSYLMAIVRDFEAAEEIFQNAALVVIEKSAEDMQVENFRAWAKEIVRRQALHYLRTITDNKRKTRSVAPELLEQIHRTFLEDEMAEPIRSRESRALQECIAEVNESQRSMLILRYQNRSSFEEIAQSVGKTQAAVQRSLSRVRKALYDCIQSKIRTSAEV